MLLTGLKCSAIAILAWSLDSHSDPCLVLDSLAVLQRCIHAGGRQVSSAGIARGPAQQRSRKASMPHSQHVEPSLLCSTATRLHQPLLCITPYCQQPPIATVWKASTLPSAAGSLAILIEHPYWVRTWHKNEVAHTWAPHTGPLGQGHKFTTKGTNNNQTTPETTMRTPPPPAINSNRSTPRKHPRAHRGGKGHKLSSILTNSSLSWPKCRTLQDQPSDCFQDISVPTCCLYQCPCRLLLAPTPSRPSRQ